MGEAADDAIDRGMDEWMSDAYYDDQYYTFTPSPRTCRDCGKSGLSWGQSDGNWRLFDGPGKVHVCSAKKAFR